MEVGLSDVLSAVAVVIAGYSAIVARSVAKREARRDTERIQVIPLIGAVTEDS